MSDYGERHGFRPWHKLEQLVIVALVVVVAGALEAFVIVAMAVAQH
jgi:hypothetical protein